jgi:hypothetical protein
MNNGSLLGTHSVMNTDEDKNNQAAKALPAPLVSPAPLTTSTSSETPVEPPRVVPKSPAPLPLPTVSVFSPPSPLNASRRPDEEFEAVLTMEMFKKKILKNPKEYQKRFLNYLLVFQKMIFKSN